MFEVFISAIGTIALGTLIIGVFVALLVCIIEFIIF